MQLYELENDERVIVIAGGIGIDRNQLQAILEPFVKAVHEAVLILSEKIATAIDGIRQLYREIEVVISEELERESKREIYKLDFKRPKIEHQVMCRKPKHQVKKIIR